MALTDNLISYWKLDEASGDALDAHGSNTLTDVNSVAATGSGIINGARVFNNTTDARFTHVHNSDLGLGTDTDFTWTFWLKLASDSATYPILNKSETPFAGADDQYYLAYNAGSGRVAFRVGNGSTSQQFDGTTYPGVTNWHFFIAWHDSGLDKLFLQMDDEVTPAEAAWSGGTQNTTGSFALGGLVSTPTLCLEGSLDEVGFWKRVLTAPERTSLYNSGAGLPYSSFGSAAALMGQILT